MSKYKSRITEVSQVKSKQKTGGNIVKQKIRKPRKRRLTEKILNFVDANPVKAHMIANEVLGKPKGAGLASNIAKGVLLAGTGAGAGALAFREYLKSNPEQATKLILSGIAGTSAKLVQTLGAGLNTGGALVEPELAFKTVQDAKQVAEQVIPKIKKIGKKISKQIKPFNFKNLNHTVLKHIIGNATPHEFNLIRGVASQFLNRSHPLSKHIKKHLGGSFVLPKKIHKEAMQDIIRAPSTHHLSEMIHNEEMDMRRGKKVGGGLFDSLGTIFKRGIEGVNTIATGALSVGRSFNSVLQRGLLIASAIEPLIELIDPALGDVFSAAVHNARGFQQSVNLAVSAGDTVHNILHGQDALGIEQASNIINVDIPQPVEGLEGTEEVGGTEEIAQTGAGLDIDEQEKLRELRENIKLLDELNV